jgi:SAM-dependent methyltransferase
VQPLTGVRVAHVPRFWSPSNQQSAAKQVRTWCGDVVDLPAARGPADAVLFDACLGFAHDQHAALWAACRLLRPGGHIVISRPMSG